MRFQSENSGSTTYLTYEIGPKEELDQISLGMLTNNKIPHILSASYYVKDTQQQLRYNISSKISLKKFLSARITKKQILTIFRSISDAFLSTEEYMLLQEQLIADMEHIYVNVGTAEVSMICVPIENMKQSVDLRLLFKELLFSAQFETHENGNYIMEISNYLNGIHNFSVMDFKELLQKLMEKQPEPSRAVSHQAESAAQAGSQMQIPPARQEMTIPAAAAPAPPKEKTKAEKKAEKKAAKKPEKSAVKDKGKPEPPALMSQGKQSFMIPGMDAPVSVNAVPEKKEKTLFSFLKKGKKEVQEEAVPQPVPLVQPVFQQNGFSQDMPIGETTVLDLQPVHTSGETTVLGVSAAHLMRTKTGERILLDKPVFRLGKEKSYVDYCVSDNTAVSRSHADIIYKNGQYYITDNNSLNHTYVGGAQLKGQTEVLLHDGDKILLANEEFEFIER